MCTSVSSLEESGMILLSCYAYVVERMFTFELGELVINTYT
jgi:hypothetical protein